MLQGRATTLMSHDAWCGRSIPNKCLNNRSSGVAREVLEMFIPLVSNEQYECDFWSCAQIDCPCPPPGQPLCAALQHFLHLRWSREPKELPTKNVVSDNSPEPSPAPSQPGCIPCLCLVQARALKVDVWVWSSKRPPLNEEFRLGPETTAVWKAPSGCAVRECS